MASKSLKPIRIHRKRSGTRIRILLTWGWDKGGGRLGKEESIICKYLYTIFSFKECSLLLYLFFFFFLKTSKGDNGFLGGSVVKNLPAKQEARVCSWGREDPLEKEMAIHSRILAWEIPWTEEPGRPHTVHGVAKSDMT